MSHAQGASHPHAEAARRSARCAVLTVSDTRGPSDDAGGAAVDAELRKGGHAVVARAWCRDDAVEIRRHAVELLARDDVDALVATGGTGLAPRDVTPEAFAPLLEKALPGFGEAFRRESDAEVGGAAWLSRAGAGVADGRLVAWLPGSPKGAALGARLLAEQLGHVVALLRG
ncbi:MAG TPA: MogA/MoaB family molybdenum cofactor biosynthesis protein [Candidatus Thermoplasmatota archaeon]|nr:MogA/MoaB family molybdenum cofactor biosynthesis protein [Candidatus Thermoplasmatota archaeon]